MTSPAQPPDPPPSLIGKIIFGAVVFGVLGTATAGLRDQSVLESTAIGAIAGVGTGALWYWDSMRARRYRASFDPADRSLQRPEPVAAATPFVRRRYRSAMILRIVAALGALMAIGVAIVLWLDPQGVTAGLLAGLGAFVAVEAAFVWMVFATFTDVRADGMVVRTPTRRHLIAWDELAEVRWHREADHDVLLFRTVDGREIKATSVTVTASGFHERRMLRLRADIESAWAASKKAVGSSAAG